jgi:hypothetical protein
MSVAGGSDGLREAGIDSSGVSLGGRYEGPIVDQQRDREAAAGASDEIAAEGRAGTVGTTGTVRVLFADKASAAARIRDELRHKTDEVGLQEGGKLGAVNDIRLFRINWKAASCDGLPGVQ